MTYSKHTPGPWRWMANDGNPDALMVVAGTIGSCGICHVINRPAGTKAQPTTEHPYNARLIASAPELLESLRELLEICRFKCSPRDEVLLPDGKTNEQAMKDAMAVLSRAT